MCISLSKLNCRLLQPHLHHSNRELMCGAEHINDILAAGIYIASYNNIMKG